MYYSSMNWEVFSKNISVAEFSAHERGLRERPSGHGGAAGGGAGPTHTCAGGHGGRFTSGSPDGAKLFKSAPEVAGACGLGHGSFGLASGVPPGDPGVHTQD